MHLLFLQRLVFRLQSVYIGVYVVSRYVGFVSHSLFYSGYYQYPATVRQYLLPPFKLLVKSAGNIIQSAPRSEILVFTQIQGQCLI